VQYKTANYAIPDTLSGKYYHMIQAFTSDTNYLPGVIVTAKPSREVFDKLFLTTEIPGTKLDIAMRNLEREKLLQQFRALEPDAYENYRNFISYQCNQQYNKVIINQRLSLLVQLHWPNFSVHGKMESLNLAFNINYHSLLLKSVIIVTTTNV